VAFRSVVQIILICQVFGALYLQIRLARESWDLPKRTKVQVLAGFAARVAYVGKSALLVTAVCGAFKWNFFFLAAMFAIFALGDWALISKIDP
jgi:hypothetical protein